MRTRNLLLGMLVCIFTIRVAAAQETPRVEIFTGYSYLQGNPSHYRGFNSHGWDASLVGNLNRWFGVESDFSNHYGTSAGDLINTGNYAPRFSFLFGPHLSYRKAPGITPFAHALFGGVQGTAESIILGPCSPGRCFGGATSQTAFAMAFGGGLDLKATRHIKIRLIQADYLRANFTGSPQNDVRLSTGIVFTFGKR